MRAVLTDRSLCALPLKDNAPPEQIIAYIQALVQAGVKYIELDFNTVMRLKELPDGVGYIFRLCDPRFAELAHVFDFSYVLLTLNDFKAKLSLPVPAIVELPSGTHLSQGLYNILNGQLDGKLGMVRLRGDFEFETVRDAANVVMENKRKSTVPLDFCPTNGHYTALDSAIKLFSMNADCITMCMGTSGMYAGLEEFVFTLMTVFGIVPPELNPGAIIRASSLSKSIFRSEPDGISIIKKLLDFDMENLVNADTGKRVFTHVVANDDDSMLFQNVTSALEKMAEEEDIPEDIMEDIMGALFRYSFSLSNSHNSKKPKAFLN